MKNSLFAFIMVASLIFVSCGSENKNETIEKICNTTTSICGSITDLCKLYNVSEACNIASEVCYYTNNICSYVIKNSENIDKIEKASSDLSILSQSLDNIKSNNVIGDTPINSIDIAKIMNVLDKLVIIEQNLTSE